VNKRGIVIRLASSVLANWAAMAGCAAASEPARPVALVADDWCPQHCEGDTQRKGYIVDIVGQALAAEGVAYTIVYRPWTRALRLTEQGAFDGLLTPTVNGYPQFVFNKEAVGYQQYCFYVNADSDWTYSAPPDLLGKRIAHLKESGFGKLEKYIAANQRTIHIQEFVGSKGMTDRMFKFLAAGRADAVIMTSDVYDLGRRDNKTMGTFKQAGCLANEKLAVGLSQANPERSRWIARKLDRGIRKLRQSGQLKTILAQYGIAPP
jgi:polar amino acid transport system substrate-binding protein